MKLQRLFLVAGTTILAVSLGLAGIWHFRLISAASALKARIEHANDISLLNNIAENNSLSGVIEEEIRALARAATEGDQQTMIALRSEAVKAAGRYMFLTVVETGVLLIGFILFTVIAVLIARKREKPPVVLTLAQTLARIREIEGLSIRQLADRIGTHRNRIWRIEKGAGKPDPEILRYLEKEGWIRQVRPKPLEDVFVVPQKYLIKQCVEA